MSVTGAIVAFVLSIIIWFIWLWWVNNHPVDMRKRKNDEGFYGDIYVKEKPKHTPIPQYKPQELDPNPIRWYPDPTRFMPDMTMYKDGGITYRSLNDLEDNIEPKELTQTERDEVIANLMDMLPDEKRSL